MNKKRRDKLSEISDRIEDITFDISMVICDEQEALGSMPENLQGSERAIAMEDAIDVLQDAMDDMHDISSKIREI